MVRLAEMDKIIKLKDKADGMQWKAEKDCVHANEINESNTFILQVQISFQKNFLFRKFCIYLCVLN